MGQLTKNVSNKKLFKGYTLLQNYVGEFWGLRVRVLGSQWFENWILLICSSPSYLKPEITWIWSNCQEGAIMESVSTGTEMEEKVKLEV